jgi:hypothetical protein
VQLERLERVPLPSIPSSFSLCFVDGPTGIRALIEYDPVVVAEPVVARLSAAMREVLDVIVHHSLHGERSSRVVAQK